MPSEARSGSVAYDAAEVAADARQAAPGLTEGEALELAEAAYAHLRAVGADDVGELARRLLERASEVSHANVIARAAVDFCASHDVDLGG